MDDLSDYERIRLDNIRRNQLFLQSLGLGEVKETLKPSAGKDDISADDLKRKKREAAQQRKEEQKRAAASRGTDGDAAPRRVSLRIKGIAAEAALKASQTGESHSEEEDDGTIHYSVMPDESNQLDDFEFQAFLELRKWRLQRHRELGVEPYKIFQNRTFCEMVRRRRNDPHWAREPSAAADSGGRIDGEHKMHSPTRSPKRVKKEADGAAPSSIAAAKEEPSSKVIDDLLMCWGVGPSKVRWPEGFAHEALVVLNDPSVSTLLHKSASAHSEHKD